MPLGNYVHYSQTDFDIAKLDKFIFTIEMQKCFKSNDMQKDLIVIHDIDNQ